MNYGHIFTVILFAELAWLYNMYSRHTLNIKSDNAIYLMTLNAIFVSGD